MWRGTFGGLVVVGLEGFWDEVSEGTIFIGKSCWFAGFVGFPRMKGTKKPPAKQTVANLL